MALGLGVERGLETWIGNTVLVFYIVSFVMNPIWGGVADHYGRKLMMLRATFGMGFFMVMSAFAPTPLWFAVLLCCVGVFNGNSGAGMALIVANTPPQRLGTALSLAHTGILVGQTIGPGLGALIATLIARPHWVFWVSGGMLIAAGVLVLILVREVKQLAPGPWRLQWLGPLRRLLAVPRIGALFLLAFVFAVLWSGNVTIMSLMTLQLLPAQDTAVQARWVGAVALSLAVAGLLAMPLWGWALDRFRPARVLALATAAAAATHVPLIFLETPVELVVARALFGIGAGGMQPAIFRLLKEHAPAGMDARAIAYATSFQFIAMGLAPFTAGLIGPALGLRAYFALTIVLTIAGLVIWLRAGRVVRP